MPPATRTISAPLDGWEPQTYYIVEAAFDARNPVGRYIFFSGFLNGGQSKSNPLADKTPGGYNQFLRLEGPLTIDDAHYLQPIHKLARDSETGVSTLDGNYNQYYEYKEYYEQVKVDE
jgi:hypothetical protein